MIRIQNNILASLATIALLAAATAYAGESVDEIKQRIGSGNPVAGKTMSSLCQGCHGELGVSLDELIPSLAGQYASYIATQLRSYQSGARTHQIMNAMAMTINDVELANIAAFFASQKKMQGKGSGDNPVAKNLFLKGDAKRGIPACTSCHGTNGKGKAPNIPTYPVIGGQHKGYLSVQLTHLRNSERSDSQGGVMNKIAKSLTNAEIEALSAYLSGL